MTNIYVNGKKVSKEELKNIEITNERVKHMLREAISKSERKAKEDQDSQTDKDSDGKHSTP